MKEKYLRSKKNIGVNMSLSCTFFAIGICGIIAAQYVLGAILLITGICFGGLILYCKNQVKKFHFMATEFCPLCNKSIVVEKEMRYYLGGSLTTEDELLMYNSHNERKIMDITYYKCLECNFCMTEITQYMLNRADVKKQISHKTSIDFDYQGQY